MKKLKIWAIAAACGLVALESWAQPIAVPTFGALFTNPDGFIDYLGGQTFGDPNPPGWTVTPGYNAYGNINVVGNGWQSPDGLASVEMDGKAPPAQISTPIMVPYAGIVTIQYWLAADPNGDAGFTDTQPKYLEVQLGTGVGIGPGVTNIVDGTGKSTSNMGWILVTDQFLASAGLNYITFSSLDFPGVDFSNGSDSGAAVGTVTAYEGGGVPETAPTVLLLALGTVAMIGGSLGWRTLSIKRG